MGGGAVDATDRSKLLTDYGVQAAKDAENQKRDAISTRGQTMNFLGRLLAAQVTAGDEAGANQTRMAIASMQETGRNTRASATAAAKPAPGSFTRGQLVDKGYRGGWKTRPAGTVKGALIQASDDGSWWLKPTKAAGGKGAASNGQLVKSGAKLAASLWDGVARKATQADVTAGHAAKVGETVYDQYSEEEILRRLVATGLSAKAAQRIVIETTGDATGGAGYRNGPAGPRMPGA